MKRIMSLLALLLALLFFCSGCDSSIGDALLDKEVTKKFNMAMVKNQN